MKLSELISEIGDENVKVQMLQDSLIGNQSQGKGHIKITFATSELSLIELVDPNSPHIGMVIWLPRKKVDESMKRTQQLFGGETK